MVSCDSGHICYMSGDKVTLLYLITLYLIYHQQVPGTILGSENCQSILFQSLLSASHLFMLCDLTLSNETVRQVQSFCQITAPHNMPFMSLWPAKHTWFLKGYKVKVQSVRDHFCQSFIITACHDDWLTGVWNSLCQQHQIIHVIIISTFW